MRSRGAKSYSLRGQLGILFAALAVPLLLLQAWWGYHDVRGARERAWTDALAFADAVDLGVRQFIDQSGELLTGSAEQSGPEWLAAGGCSDEMDDLRDLLSFANALVVRMDGRVVCSAADVPPDADASDWSWFDGFRSRGEFLVGPPVVADFTGERALPLVAPIHGEDGEVLGALVGTMRLIELSRLLGGFRPPDEQLTTVATADRVIIARSIDPERWLGESLPTPTGSDRLVAPGRWVAEGPDLTGISRTWGQVRTESGWIIYVGIPDAVVFGPALREALAHMAGTLLVVLAALLLGALSYRRIADALHDLADKTKVSEAGEMIPVVPGTPKEISEVVEQFNQTLHGRVRAEAAERAARRRFQSIFDNAVFGIYVSTPDGRFLQVNPALVEMLGYESEDALIEAGPEALYADPARRAGLVEAAGGLGIAETGSHDLEWVRADGTPIVVRVRGKTLDGPEGSPVFEMIVQDVTEEKRTEETLLQKQKMEAVGQLAGGVAHDFNNLLTVIGGNVELLEDDLPRDDPLREDLEQIAKATRRAGSLTRRLLSFSRPTRRGEESVDVSEVIPDFATMLAPLIGETVSLETRLEKGSHFVTIDPGELEQLVVNLVLNARDAIRGEGTIVIEAGRAEKEVGGTRRDGLSLAVIDEGIGMDAETRKKIFEPFYTTKPMGEGTGLGLSTVYGIVQRAGGDVSVRSEPGQGTRMEVWLPLATEHEVATLDADERPHRVISGTESILVVEDDELVRSFVKRALRQSGFDVHLSSSGDEALALLREQEGSVDLVLTDVVMPGLSGPELAERLAVDYPDTPVLFMSGYIDNEPIDDELSKEPGALLRKPFTLHELQVSVREALDRGAEAAAAR